MDSIAKAHEAARVLEIDEGQDELPKPTQKGFMLNEHDTTVAARLKWKIDLWVLPLITFVYLLAAMDRSDIGNAQVAGMQKAIGASNGQWSDIVSLFYVGFVIGQAAGVYTLRSLTPQIVLGFAVIIWGLATTCMITVSTYQQAEGLRIIIGFCEGIDHAALLYLSLWYTPKELATRSGVFYSASSLAGAFNGLIAYAIVTNYSHKPPFEPWQWLLMIEGIISIGYGLVIVFLLPPVPERLRWGFSEDEKRLAIVRTLQANNTPGAKIRWVEVPSTFKNPMLYVYTFLLMGTAVCLSGLSSFLPALVQTMGYSSVQAQLMTVPVYAVAFVATLFFTNMSDRTSMRGPWLMGLSTTSFIGVIILLTVEHNHTARYAAICLTAMGMYPSVMIITTWVAVNTRNYTHRATMSAVTNMLAQCVVAASVQAFSKPPYYFAGLKIVSAFVALMIPLSAFGIFYVKWENRKKTKALAENSAETRALRAMTLEKLGSDHPEFFYEI